MARGRPAIAIVLSKCERDELESLVRRRSTAQSVAVRARIVLMAADGATNTAIGERLKIGSQHTVGRWRKRFARERVDGLFDEPRPGAPRTIGDDEIAETIRRTLETMPVGATHWSLRSMDPPSCGRVPQISRHDRGEYARRIRCPRSHGQFVDAQDQVDTQLVR